MAAGLVKAGKKKMAVTWDTLSVRSVTIEPTEPPVSSQWDAVSVRSVTIEPSITLPGGWDPISKLKVTISPKTQTNWLLIGGIVFGVGTVVALATVFKR
jgi:uncharacterized membrane protein YedE/YeeE